MKKWMQGPLIVLTLAFLYWIGSMLNPSSAPRAKPQPRAQQAEAAPSPRQQDRVLATVNGEQIHESDVDLQLAGGSFAMQEGEARQVRLERMVKEVSLRQYLQKEKAQVEKSEIDKEVESLRKNPPSSGCICCRYQSLEEFMRANYYDMKELRMLLGNELALRKHLDGLWEREYGTVEKGKALVEEKRAEVEKNYVCVSHIFFNTFQNIQYQEDRLSGRKMILGKAQAALERLQKGEAFEAVAKAVSEDANSRDQGGGLGCIWADTFGPDVKGVVLSLKIGEYSRPVESPWGFHIVRREAIEDKGVLEVAKSEFLDRKRCDVLNMVRMNTKVEYPGQ